jgi:hypothetical protein
LLSNILREFALLFEKCSSKHTTDAFIQYYSDTEKLQDLHDNIRYMSDLLNEIHYIAIGENYD